MLSMYSPVPTTSWEKVGGQFDESRTEVSHHELYMYDAQLSDSGVYTCSGQNSANQNAVVRSFNVTVECKLGSDQSIVPVLPLWY